MSATPYEEHVARIVQAVAEGVSCHICGGRVDGTSENDCGCFHAKAEARRSFEMLWESINGKRASWGSNPYVWVVGFKRITAEELHARVMAAFEGRL